MYQMQSLRVSKIGKNSVCIAEKASHKYDCLNTFVNLYVLASDDLRFVNLNTIWPKGKVTQTDLINFGYQSQDENRSNEYW